MCVLLNNIFILCHTLDKQVYFPMMFHQRGSLYFIFSSKMQRKIIFTLFIILFYGQFKLPSHILFIQILTNIPQMF